MAMSEAWLLVRGGHRPGVNVNHKNHHHPYLCFGRLSLLILRKSLFAFCRCSLQSMLHNQMGPRRQRQIRRNGMFISCSQLLFSDFYWPWDSCKVICLHILQRTICPIHPWLQEGRRWWKWNNSAVIKQRLNQEIWHWKWNWLKHENEHFLCFRDMTLHLFRLYRSIG